MTKQELNELLDKAGLSKKELASMVDLQPSSIHNWGSSQNVPHWVHSWLVNYIEAKTLREFKEKLDEVEGLKKK